MSELRTELPPANDGSPSVSHFNDKAQAYFRLAAEHIQRAAKTTDPKLTTGFLQLARSYRELAIKAGASSRWRSQASIEVE